MLVIVCPGQGSQTPGFLAPWLELPAFRERLESLSDVAGLDLVAHGTTSDADTIKDTAVAQPLIVGAGLAAVPTWRPTASSPRTPAPRRATRSARSPPPPSPGSHGRGCDGVRPRAGRGMAAASAVTATGMSAVLGATRPRWSRCSTSTGSPPPMPTAQDRWSQPARWSSCGTGCRAPAKARVIALQVAGAFHTHHMAPAVTALGEQVQSFSVGKPTLPPVSNADGAVLHDGRDVLARLVSR